ncbi:MAG: hypothetical protein HY820_16565 [Acidobacteria bacterium]|nr:hypothetical protein [Acidobacteriota bacterium]
MRAICESCTLPQPPGWKAGDYCVHCGKTVRRELRCFWCAKWTPAAKFCRSCAAVVVEPEQYGAARMLKHAGVDRFTIPKMLGEMDPEQIENFANIYSRHATVMTQHVEQARLLERSLYQRHWSAELEEQLIVELPWEEARLRELDVQVPAMEIHKRSPIPLLRSLAGLARLHLGDPIDNGEVFELYNSPHVEVRSEAILQLSTWRAIFGAGVPIDQREMVRALRESPCPGPAAAHRILLGDREAQVPADAVLSADDEFCVDVGTRNVDRLRAALRSDDALQRHVAAKVLIDAGEPGGIDEVLLAATGERQLELLKKLSMRRKPVPDLRRTLTKIAEETKDRGVLSAACHVLCFGVPPGEAVRLAELSGRDRTIYQALLQRAELPPEYLAELCGHWVETGEFNAGQWGMDDVAKPGRMPLDFVPRQWSKASDEVRVELIAFAEVQLRHAADEGLHRFLVQRLFAPDAEEVVIQTWKCLYRWYSREVQLVVSKAALTRFFDAPAAFLPVLRRFLGDGEPPAMLREMWIREPLAKLIRYSEDDVLSEWAASPREVEALFDAMSTLMADGDQDFTLRYECAGFAAFVAQEPRLRAAARLLLKAHLGSDIDYHCKNALERIDRLEGAE